MPRLYCPVPLASGQLVTLPAAATRHAQVLRMQPGDALTLFNGTGGEFDAQVTAMGRAQVQVQVGAHHAVEREAHRALHLAVGMPANERMDWLVEKATELGAASVQPLQSARSVLKLRAERALSKQAHWQAVANAACEQCGRNRVPLLHPVRELSAWLTTIQPGPGLRLLLSLRSDAQTLTQALATALLSAGQASAPVTLLSGPEGGLTEAEERSALAAGFVPVSLGAQVLRAETAPLAALAALTLPT